MLRQKPGKSLRTRRQREDEQHVRREVPEGAPEISREKAAAMIAAELGTAYHARVWIGCQGKIAVVRVYVSKARKNPRSRPKPCGFIAISRRGGIFHNPIQIDGDDEPPPAIRGSKIEALALRAVEGFRILPEGGRDE